MQAQVLMEEEDAQEGRYLTFGVAGEIYGIEIRYVTEIVGLQPITGIPEMPDYVKGIINLRGKVFPVIDMRIRFLKNSAAYTDRTCIIVVELQDVTVGFIVDKVEEVLSIGKENVAPPPDQKTGADSRNVKGIGKTANGIILLLDCEKVLRDGGVDAENERSNKIEKVK
jgi:purine-binding chemotaxis protein CheW